MIVREFFHKLMVGIFGVASGMGAYWYSQNHAHQNLWVLGAIAVAVTVVLGLLFHPVLWLFRHRPRPRYSPADSEA